MTRLKWWPWALVVIGIAMIAWSWGHYMHSISAPVSSSIFNQATMEAVDQLIHQAEPGTGCDTIPIPMPNGIGTVHLSQPSVVTVKIDHSLGGVYFIESPDGSKLNIGNEQVFARLLLPAGIQVAGEHISAGEHRLFFVASIDGDDAVLASTEALLFVCPAWD